MHSRPIVRSALSLTRRLESNARVPYATTIEVLRPFPSVVSDDMVMVQFDLLSLPKRILVNTVDNVLTILLPKNAHNCLISLRAYINYKYWIRFRIHVFE